MPNSATLLSCSRLRIIVLRYVYSDVCKDFLTSVKLFFSGNHANAGLEEPFPTPDNVQKMRRSIENAETVGLCPTGLYNPMRGIGRNGRRAAPPARVLRSVGPVYAGVQRQQVQAPSVPLLSAPTTPATGSGATISPAYTQSGGSTGSAPSSSVSSHFSHSNMVDTSSPSDPFFGRADRLRENTHFISTFRLH